MFSWYHDSVELRFFFYGCISTLAVYIPLYRWVAIHRYHPRKRS